MRINLPINKSDGFTLLEVLATIIVSALLSVVLVQAIGRYPGRSHSTLQSVKKSMAIKSAMENISAQYSFLMRSADANPLITLQESINGNNFGDETSPKHFWDTTGDISGLATCIDSVDGQEIIDENNNNNCNIAHHYLKVTLRSTVGDTQPVISIFTR